MAMISDILGIFSLGSIVQCIVAKTGEVQRSEVRLRFYSIRRYS